MCMHLALKFGVPCSTPQQQTSQQLAHLWHVLWSLEFQLFTLRPTLQLFLLRCGSASARNQFWMVIYLRVQADLRPTAKGCLIASSLQVQAFIRGNAEAGVVQQALESMGTPNLLLQTDLTQIPTLTINPTNLPPAVLFEGSFSATFNQTMTINNEAQSAVNYTVSFLPSA